MAKARHTVLIVEDDASMNLAIKRVLNAAGFDAASFTSGEELLRTGVMPTAGCLVIDLRLPGRSGFDLVERLAERRSFLPVVFITAHDEPETRQQAEKAGAVAYLAKPFDGKSLIDAVNRALHSP
ncbi:MAG TPA: response regulator [Candidatus Binatia bacterium]|nr:response regulator [Candidatus Binatia bacterium]